MRRVRYQVADRHEYAEWLYMRNPVMRGKTTIIDTYDMSIQSCTPIVFSVDKVEFLASEYDSISLWISSAISKVSTTATFVTHDSFVPSQLEFAHLADSKIEHQNGNICLSADIQRYEGVASGELCTQFITVFSDPATLNQEDLSCVASIKSVHEMIPTRDQIAYMIDRFGAFASCIRSHYPVEFPAYVLWCDRVHAEAIQSCDDRTIPEYKSDQPILKCETLEHDWGMSSN